MRGEDFERVFTEHAASLFAFFVYRTGNRPLSEDLVADTFERVLRARRRFDPRRGSEKNWIYTIALNRLRDEARRTASEERALQRVAVEAAGSRADSEAIAFEQRDQLGRALATLSEQEQEAIALRFGADLTLREVARVLGEPASAVEKRIYRALARLRDELSD